MAGEIGTKDEGEGEVEIEVIPVTGLHNVENLFRFLPLDHFVEELLRRGETNLGTTKDRSRTRELENFYSAMEW